MAEGLIHSRNTMTVRVGDRAGLDVVAQFAEKAGFPEVPLNVQSYIGNFHASPRDRTVATTVPAKAGRRRESRTGWRNGALGNPGVGEVVGRGARAGQ